MSSATAGLRPRRARRQGGTDRDFGYDNRNGEAASVTFPTTGVLDDFNTGASQNLTSRAGWNTGVAESGDRTLVTDSTPTEAQATINDTYSNAWATQASDTEVWIELGSWVNSGIQLFARMSGTIINGNTCYLLDYTTAGVWSINYFSGGMNNVAQNLSGPVLATGDSIGLRVVGSSLAAFHKPAAGAWTQIVSGTDATFSNTGYFAVVLNSVAGTRGINLFGGGDVSAAPSTARSESIIVRRVWTGR